MRRGMRMRPRRSRMQASVSPSSSGQGTAHSPRAPSLKVDEDQGQPILVMHFGDARRVPLTHIVARLDALADVPIRRGTLLAIDHIGVVVFAAVVIVVAIIGIGIPVVVAAIGAVHAQALNIDRVGALSRCKCGGGSVAESGLLDYALKSAPFLVQCIRFRIAPQRGGSIHPSASLRVRCEFVTCAKLTIYLAVAPALGVVDVQGEGLW
mmetsp:Transcript_12262/g.32070  ORF Transcript_12262/g.32070 Transcript_12262/m.32070 type:complete len:209 (+) Transcript_12262:765-1391(+)